MSEIGELAARVAEIRKEVAGLVPSSPLAVELPAVVPIVPSHSGDSAGVQALVTGSEAARRLGLSRSRVSQLARQPRFPEPVGRLASATIWRWADVEAWARATGRPLRD